MWMRFPSRLNFFSRLLSSWRWTLIRLESCGRVYLYQARGQILAEAVCVILLHTPFLNLKLATWVG